MPQWDFLDFLARHGKRYPTFGLRMKAEAADLIEEDARIVGVRAKTPDGTLTIRADLVVGCDGRHSTVREKAGFKSEDYGAPMDVLWFRVSRHPGDSADTFGHVEAGKMMVMLDRGDYWQCAYVIPKGGIERVKTKGLAAFRSAVVDMSPFLADRIGELKSWDDIKLLSVTVDRLQKWWRHGLICIGDSAHAMSPIGGVGINIAVQDAVAAANRLAAPLKAGSGHRSRPAGDPGSPHFAGAIYAVAATHRAEAGRQPRAGRNGAAEAAAVVPTDRNVSDPAPLAGASARRRHPARARTYAGCLCRTGIARGAPRRVNPGCFSSFAIRRRRGRGFRQGVIPPRDRFPTACAPLLADDRRWLRRAAADRAGLRVRHERRGASG